MKKILNNKILNNKILLKKIMLLCGLLYLALALVLLIFRMFEAIIEGNPVIDNIMYNFRTFSLGLLSVDRNYNFLVLDPIGFLAIPLTIFFGIFFYLTIDINWNVKNRIIIGFMLTISILSIIVNIRIPLCVMPGICLFSILYYLDGIVNNG